MVKWCGGALVTALLIAAASPAAFAGSADSTGGIKVKSDDGRFEGVLGGRIQYDYETFDKDAKLSGAVPGASKGGSFAEGPFMRRAYITLSGKAFDFKYKLEYDLASLGNASAAGAANSGSGAAKEVWLGTDVLAGFIKAGHMQPAYGMEETTSSNEILFTERPYISNNTVYSGREFQNAISYDTHALPGLMAMVAVYEANTANDKNTNATQSTANGHGYSARVTYAPLMTDTAVVHVGISYDDVQWKTGGGANAPAVTALEVAKNAPALNLIAAGAYDEQKTPVGEVAGRFGPFFAQAEYTKAKYAFLAAPDQSLTSYYAQASVFVTGESKPYKADKGVFGNPKPASLEWGAVELKARFDTVKNDDAATKPKASMTSFGVNYYFNPNVRVMADYNIADAQTIAGKDKPKALVLRGQIAF